MPARLSPALAALALKPEEVSYLVAVGTISYQPSPLHGNAGPRDREPLRIAPLASRQRNTAKPART